MSRRLGAASCSAAATPSGVAAADLPAAYTPKVAGYALGPFVEGVVTPNAWRWKNCRTYLVTVEDGTTYRTVRVTNTRNNTFAGYWAVELRGVPLTLGMNLEVEL